MSKNYLTERAQKIFDETWKLCNEFGVVREIDREMIEGYAVEMATFQEASEMVIRYGEVVTLNSGKDAPSGWVEVRNAALKQAFNIAKMYGFTPTGRKQLGLENQKQSKTKFATLTAKPKIA